MSADAALNYDIDKYDHIDWNHITGFLFHILAVHKRQRIGEWKHKHWQTEKQGQQEYPIPS